MGCYDKENGDICIEDVTKSYEDNSSECMNFFERYIGDSYDTEDYEITDEQEKIKIVKKLIEFANDVKDEAIN